MAVRLPIHLILPALFCLLSYSAAAQQGQISGVIQDEAGVPLEKATVRLGSRLDSAFSRILLSGRDGEFQFDDLPWSVYVIEISYSGHQSLVLDSIHVRAEKELFSMGIVPLKQAAGSSLAEVIVVAERPLIESKDGNITFNVAESPLAAGASADELLAQVPLVTKDADGKLTVRGKEPRILIDDKPVELNMQQLQELLEATPGSAIEKIEVLQNPPPQYANEQGGVINIIMKKGRVGRTARVNMSAGTRGEASANGHFTYRKSGLAFSLNAGVNRSRIRGNGNSYRENFFQDSVNYFQTANRFRNLSTRPSLRANLDYTINKYQSVTATAQLNGNNFDNRNETEYRNRNRLYETYRLSTRAINNYGESANGLFNVSYLTRSKRAGEQLRIIAGVNVSASESNRLFYQQYYFPDYQPTGQDSTQWQLTQQLNSGWNLRANYDRRILNEKTTLSVGTSVVRNSSDVQADAFYLQKSDQTRQPLGALSNDFLFQQTVLNGRIALRRRLGERTSLTAGVSAEQTSIFFNLRKMGEKAANSYWTFLPFANFNRNFNDLFNLSLAYRRSIRRPGINELNPTIDFSDPYNVRFGNVNLVASTSDNFDLVIGRTRPLGYINLGLGFNQVHDIFSRVRTLLGDGRTQLTWENISGRKEYELSSWGGITIDKRLRLNMSASYTYNQYSEHDRRVNRFRNGGSFTSSLNSSFTMNDRWNFTTGMSVNRFANPQGFGRWTLGMNTGVQHKMLQKRLTVTANVIDPFWQLRNINRTYGPNFYLENESLSRTRNFRITLGYNLIAASARKA